jgi:hypothetical protein
LPTLAHSEVLAAQQARARQLSNDRRCPHCAQSLSLLDVLSMARGHGYVYYVRVQLPDGRRVLVEEPAFNPQTMLWDNGTDDLPREC